jgi:hypothetical protein
MSTAKVFAWTIPVGMGWLGILCLRYLYMVLEVSIMVVTGRDKTLF